MLDHNKKMKEFLQANGIICEPHYIPDGSMRGTWRLTGRADRRAKLFDDRYQKWTPELEIKLDGLGFKDFDGKPLNQYSGNGGFFSIFVRSPIEVKNL